MADAPQDTRGLFRDWHVRKEFHIGHIVSIILAMAAIGTTLVQMHSSIGDAQRRIDLLETRASQTEMDAGALSRLLERLDERSVQQSQQLSRIEHRLESRDGPR